MATTTQKATTTETDENTAMLKNQLTTKEYNTMSTESRKKYMDYMKKCNADSINLAALTVNYDLQANELKIAKEDIAAKNKLIDSLQAQVNGCPIHTLMSPSGCSVIIVLIICVTLIAMKKGVKITKGDAKVSIGENKE